MQKITKEIMLVLRVLMIAFMMILPPLFGGQIMIWWSTVFARIMTALIAVVLTKKQVYN